MTPAAASDRQKAKAMESIRTTLTTTPLRLHRTEATMSSATPVAREGRAGWGEYSSGRDGVEAMRRRDSAWARRPLQILVMIAACLCASATARADAPVEKKAKALLA